MEMEYYAIRLSAVQSISLFGFVNAKKTLTWEDIRIHKSITFLSCVESGIASKKLYNLQPILKEWIKNKKVTINDINLLDEWKPDPFQDFNCSIGDLVVYRKQILPQLLIQCGIDFNILTEKYGLNLDLMFLLKYTLDEWIQLGMHESFVQDILQLNHRV